MSSPTYIAFLRGINVNGHRIIKMADLRACLEQQHHDDDDDDGVLSFTAVRTWLQSGNVLFQCPTCSDIATLEAKIAALLQKDFGFCDVPIMVRTSDSLREAVANNPFADKDPKRLFLAILEEAPAQARLDAMAEVDYSPEEYRVCDRFIYFYVPNFAKYKLDTTLFEKRLGVVATSRNWKTANKLIELSQAEQSPAAKTKVTGKDVTERVVKRRQSARKRKR